MTQFDLPPHASPADLAGFKGTELTRVNVWKFGVTLTFDDEPRTITIEGGAEFRAQGRTERYDQEIIVAFGARVLALLGRTVVDANATDDKVFSLAFDDGTLLTLQPDGSGYECYNVNLPDGSIFVG